MSYFIKNDLWSILLALLFCNLVSLCKSNPQAIFKHYEKLKPHHISVREKRTVMGRTSSTLTVSFFALQKNFSLLLSPEASILHSNAKAELVDNLGRIKPFSLSRNKFYSGTVAGQITHKVDASEAGGRWMIHIHTPRDLYAIEPMQLYDHNAHHTDLIAYRARDIRQQNRSTEVPFCEEISFEDLFSNIITKSNGSRSQATAVYNMLEPRFENKNGTFQRSSKSLKKAKKETDSKERKLKHMFRRASGKYSDDKPTECDILAVVDYTLYKGIGARNPASVVQTIVHTYALVDKIFRESDFGGSFGPGHGIVLKGILIHTNFSDSENDYNMADLTMTPEKIIRAMTHQPKFVNYCLVHLSTQRDTGTIVGLASRASPDSDWTNGICSGLNDVYNRNVGYSTVISPSKHISSVKFYSQVVAHEIGHNWGAKHDPMSQMDRRCNPLASRGGKFIMWPYAVLRDEPNASKFSPCSLEDIRAVLKSRAKKCLLTKAAITEICGNGILEKSEECDPGFGDLDPCCESNCGLRPGAQCSFQNSPCCAPNCTVAPNSHRCYPDVGLEPCSGASYCSGDDPFRCPAPTPLPDGMSCGNEGTCMYGRCMSFCERHGLGENPTRQLTPCECDDNRESMCRICCRDTGDANGKCQAVGGVMEDGSSCLYGTCQSGVCSKTDGFRDDDLIFLKKEQPSKNRVQSNGAGRLSWATIVSVVYVLFELLSCQV